MKELQVDDSWHQREIKSKPITKSELDQLKQLAGNVEALFSRRARKYRSMGLKDKDLTETQYESLILEEYTFLKRPVILLDNELFVGSSKKVIAQVKQKLKQE